MGRIFKDCWPNEPLPGHPVRQAFRITDTNARLQAPALSLTPIGSGFRKQPTNRHAFNPDGENKAHGLTVRR